jgi:hypothetical protein
MTPDDARFFLYEVRDEFEDNKAVYDRYLALLRSFSEKQCVLLHECVCLARQVAHTAPRIDTPGVVAEVKLLFKGHGRLIEGFNAFLPEVRLHASLLLPRLMRSAAHSAGLRDYAGAGGGAADCPSARRRAATDQACP